MATPHDPRRPEKDSINLADEAGVQEWMQALSVSRDELARAVAEVGNSTGAVYDYVNRHRSSAQGK
jgi:hypothetical protein